MSSKCAWLTVARSLAARLVYLFLRPSTTAVLAGTILIGLLSTAAEATSCGGGDPVTLDQEFAKSELVFVGTLDKHLGKSKKGPLNSNRHARVKILESFKGPADGTIEVFYYFGKVNPLSCDLHTWNAFDIKGATTEKYLMFIQSVKGQYYVSIEYGHSGWVNGATVKADLEALRAKSK